jgi:hypothetical protein
MDNQGQEFADIKVSPSELRDMQFFRFRRAGIGRLVEYIRAVTPDGREVLLLDNVSKNQLVSRIGGKISELRRIYDYNERNQLLQQLAVGRSEPVILRLVRSENHWHCYAVVTDKFTEVRHSELYAIVEDELHERGLAWTVGGELRTDRRVWRTYMFERNVGQKVGDIIQVGLRVCNSVKATSSVIFYPFWKRLVCLNGMTSSRGVWKPATTHVGEKSDILQSVKGTLTEALNQAFGFEQLVERAMSIKLEDKQIDLLVREVSVRRGFADYVQRSIRYRVQKEDKTLWGLVNAFTYVSSHEVKPEQSKLTIEQSAHSLLYGGEQMVRELLAPKPAIPVQPVMHALCRECKEKPVAEVGDTCPECDVELKRVALEEDAFDHRMGLDHEEFDSDG